MQPWTNKFIRIPFKERGRTVFGADCWGLARLIYADRLGIDLPVLDGYQNIKDRKAMCEIIEKECQGWQEIPRGQEQEYDIAVFNMANLPMHVGVVVRPNTMIHCYKGAGTTLAPYDESTLEGRVWHTRIERFYRYAEGTSASIAVSPSS